MRNPPDTPNFFGQIGDPIRIAANRRTRLTRLEMEEDRFDEFTDAVLAARDIFVANRVDFRGQVRFNVRQDRTGTRESITDDEPFTDRLGGGLGFLTEFKEEQAARDEGLAPFNPVEIVQPNPIIHFSEQEMLASASN